jgi:hypothetical protein
VLRDFLPTCSERQLGDLFGEIVCFFAEGEDNNKVLRFAAAGGGRPEREG